MIERERDMSSLLVGGSLLFLLYQLSELTIREFCFWLVALAVCCLRKREKVVLTTDLAVDPSPDFGVICVLLSIISSAATVLLRYLQFSLVKLLVEIFHRLMR